jgi:hypothetical protein
LSIIKSMMQVTDRRKMRLRDAPRHMAAGVGAPSSTLGRARAGILAATGVDHKPELAHG